MYYIFFEKQEDYLNDFYIYFRKIFGFCLKEKWFSFDLKLNRKNHYFKFEIILFRVPIIGIKNLKAQNNNKEFYVENVFFLCGLFFSQETEKIKISSKIDDLIKDEVVLNEEQRQIIESFDKSKISEEEMNQVIDKVINKIKEKEDIKLMEYLVKKVKSKEKIEK